jgi:hypothetical protein
VAAAESGKRVSWVELYVALVFVLAVSQLAEVIVDEPRMHSVWVALGLFVAGSVPVGVAAVAIAPASVGDSTAFALRPRGGADRARRGARDHRTGSGGPPPPHRAGDAGVRCTLHGLDLGARAVALRAVGDRHRRGAERAAAQGPHRGPRAGPHARIIVLGAVVVEAGQAAIDGHVATGCTSTRRPT